MTAHRPITKTDILAALARVKNHREKEIARRAGCSKKSAANYRNGRSEPSATKFANLLKFCPEVRDPVLPLLGINSDTVAINQANALLSEAVTLLKSITPQQQEAAPCVQLSFCFHAQKNRSALSERQNYSTAA